MGIFSALVGVAIETVKLPLKIAADVICSPIDIQEEGIGHRTIGALEAIKDEAQKADKP